MLLDVNIAEKSFGDKILFDGFELSVDDGDKIGLIGRNGTGKSTLLNMIYGDDNDYDGTIRLKKGVQLIASRQEHQGHEHKTVIDYIVGDLPEFKKLKHVIDTYPATMGDSPKKMQVYSDALARFSQFGYFEVEGEVEEALQQYQITREMAKSPLEKLSGGQKRMAELVKVQRARAHLALIDEPTNHMDYVAKASFVAWMNSTKSAVMVITHDRDVLKQVNKIAEIRDGHVDLFKGNYDDYLRINANSISNEVNQYTIVQSRITNLRADIIRFRRLKERARDPGTISRFKSLEQKSVRELAKLESVDKPSFWIDKDSVSNISKKVSESYQQLKTKNINIQTKSKSTNSTSKLIDVEGLELSYDNNPLFCAISFQLREADRLQFYGRNGAGKSTLVKQIIAINQGLEISSKILSGKIETEDMCRIGVYEQELDVRYLKMSFADAIEDVYRQKDLDITDQKIKQLLGDYLFNPAVDGKKPLSQFSGGQKARFQLMSMLAGDPNLLILDEPTNHLDLPSIEELEDALANYHGAIIYVSHDSYFARGMGGKRIEILSQA